MPNPSIAAATLVAALSLAPGTARADVERDTLWLARICVHEAGWSVLDGADDCAALFATLRARADRLRRPSLERALAGYSARFYAGTTPRSWARYLTAAHARRGTPRGWPGDWPGFGAYRERWAAVLEAARAIVRGEVGSPCSEPPHHWAARIASMLERAEERIAAGDWIAVDCGETRNAFYAVVPWRMDGVELAAVP